MDLDIEMGDDAQPMPLEMEDPTRSTADDILQTDEPEEAGEVLEDTPAQSDSDSKTLLPTKIHIRGLDTLKTDDIKSYVAAHYGSLDRVEWIDDTSANLLFPSEPSARDALIALSTIDIADPTALAVGEETLPAKPFEGRPEIGLHIRYAVLSDKKAPGAALRSRFYLLNPEFDPEERKRKGKYRERNGNRRDRREEETGISFEASMYDDVPRASRDRDRRSSSPDRFRNRGKELFAGGSRSRRRSNRDRSASPARSDASVSEEASSSRNRVNARSLKSRISSDNRRKELFPSKKTIHTEGGGNLDALGSAMGSAHLREEDRPRIVEGSGSFSIKGSAARGGPGDGFAIKGASAKELFPGRFGGGGAGANAGKELLDAKRRTRQRAEDLFG